MASKASSGHSWKGHAHRFKANKPTPTPRPSSQPSSRSTPKSTPVPGRSRALPATPLRDVQSDPVRASSSATPRYGLSREEDPDGDQDFLDEVIMAVDFKGRGTVGCCYYVARNETLYFMEDVQLGSVEVVDARKSASSNSLTSSYMKESRYMSNRP